MPKNEFARVIRSELFAVKPVINDAIKYIKTKIPAISETDNYELKLIFSELLFNAVIHGNKLDAKKMVSLVVKIESSGVYSTIIDEGSGFDYNQLLRDLNTKDNLYGEHGRGIKLVFALTNSLEFNTEGNLIKFYKKVSLNG